MIFFLIFLMVNFINMCREKPHKAIKKNEKKGVNGFPTPKV